MGSGRTPSIRKTLTALRFDAFGESPTLRSRVARDLVLLLIYRFTEEERARLRLLYDDEELHQRCRIGSGNPSWRKILLL